MTSAVQTRSSSFPRKQERLSAASAGHSVLGYGHELLRIDDAEFHPDFAAGLNDGRLLAMACKGGARCSSDDAR